MKSKATEARFAASNDAANPYIYTKKVSIAGDLFSQWSGQRDTNPRMKAWEAFALQAFLRFMNPF